MTPMLENALNNSPQVKERVKEYNPLAPHVSEARDIANAVLYLASEDSRCVTGAELVVDCGHLIM